MPTVMNADDKRGITERLSQANRQWAAAYPGEPADRQPVHTVYGGAHLFESDIAAKLGAAALRMLERHAPDAGAFARVLGLPGVEARPRRVARARATTARSSAPEAAPESLAEAIYSRVVEKLEREPVEDFRVDFEDGYGNRPDAEEDAHAEAAAEAMARGIADHTLPPFVGIRIKPLTQESHLRALRTLDLFVTTLIRASGGVLPPNFVVTLPKVTAAEQVTALVETFELIERGTGLFPGTLRLEIMVETPQSIVGPRGEIALPQLVTGARGRCRGAHFGTYDYTAGLGIAAAHQALSHPACEFARHVMQASLAATGVTICDGSTAILPVGPHRETPGGPPLSAAQWKENEMAVHRGWKIHYDDVRSSLRSGYYQGWDLSPGQLPTRYAAVFAFFLEARRDAAARLKTFVQRAAQATLVGSVFDDAATGQALLNFFLRGIACGAFSEVEALATGLTPEELRGRSFVKILNARRGVK